MAKPRVQSLPRSSGGINRFGGVEPYNGNKPFERDPISGTIPTHKPDLPRVNQRLAGLGAGDGADGLRRLNRAVLELAEKLLGADALREAKAAGEMPALMGMFQTRRAEQLVLEGKADHYGVPKLDADGKSLISPDLLEPFTTMPSEDIAGPYLGNVVTHESLGPR